MPIKLFLDYSSQPSRAVWAFMLLNRIPHELIETRLSRGQVLSFFHASFRLARKNSWKSIPWKKSPLSLIPITVISLSVKVMRSWGNILGDNMVGISVNSTSVRTCGTQRRTTNEPPRSMSISTTITQVPHSIIIGTRKCAFLIFNTLFAPSFNRVDPTFNP